MGYVFDFKDSRAYEQWLDSDERRFALALENRLVLDLLKPVKAETILDIGCGVGGNLDLYCEACLNPTGLDASPYMLDIASRRLGDRVDLYRGFAEDLPFDDNSFNYASLSTTLEFVEKPQKAIEEACRVAKDKVFIGVLNRYAIHGVQRRVMGIFNSSIYNRAQFFSVWEIKHLFRKVLGNVPIEWRTVCQFFTKGNHFAVGVEKSKLLQRFPFGAFAGISVTLVPRFRTRPLAMRYRSESTSGI